MPKTSRASEDAIKLLSKEHAEALKRLAGK